MAVRRSFAFSRVNSGARVGSPDRSTYSSTGSSSVRCSMASIAIIRSTPRPAEVAAHSMILKPAAANACRASPSVFGSA
jgi:hypothetical protein